MLCGAGFDQSESASRRCMPKVEARSHQLRRIPIPYLAVNGAVTGLDALIGLGALAGMIPGVGAPIAAGSLGLILGIAAAGTRTSNS
jgi:hypothetical protein